MYGKFNNTDEGTHAKEAVRNGDVTSLSIWANNLQENKSTGDVFHGAIKEVSLCIGGANPEAYIDIPYMAHTEDGLFEAEISPGSKNVEFEIYHSMEEEEMAKDETKKSAQDIIDEFDDEQLAVVNYLVDEGIRQALAEQSEEEPEDDEEEYEEDEEEYEDEEESEEEDDNEMKHNAFDADTRSTNYLSHADMKAIIEEAKKNKASLKDTIEAHLEDGVLAHSLPQPIPTEGMTGPSQETALQNYGVRDLDMLFPEFKNLNNPPEWIKRDTGWVSKVMSKVGHTPFARIKSVFANITEDEARAKGYMKTHLKTEEVFSLLKRTTDPQTVYKKQKMDRDDIIDITDFDVVRWIKAEMRLMLDEEIARAILIGDGRLNSSDDKISEDHIRPVVNDKPLFTVQCPVTVAANATGSDKAEAFIEQAIRSRKFYKGSGNPDLYTTEDMLTEMLLLKDGIGHRLYKTEAELATTLRVNSIITVEVMEGFTLNSKEFLGVIVNLADYRVGADRGGEVNLFDDFDIDYNQQKYLIETRISGALVKPFSALSFTVTVGA